MDSTNKVKTMESLEKFKLHKTDICCLLANNYEKNGLTYDDITQNKEQFLKCVTESFEEYIKETETIHDKYNQRMNELFENLDLKQFLSELTELFVTSNSIYTDSQKYIETKFGTSFMNTFREYSEDTNHKFGWMFDSKSVIPNHKNVILGLRIYNLYRSGPYSDISGQIRILIKYLREIVN